MKCVIHQLTKHETNLESKYAEKVLEYIYNNHFFPTLARATERLDKMGTLCVFPKGSHPSCIEWDVVDVQFTEQEILSFCQKHEIKDVQKFKSMLRVY